jgi:benzodiazapine receptor
VAINLKRLAASVALCVLVGIVGSIFTTPSIGGWYAGLTKPAFNPPGFIFGPVWTILYVMMGIALYLVWQKKANKQLKKSAFKIFGIQLALNFLWSIIFFGFHSPGIALIEIILLWLSIFLTIRAFSKVDKISSYILYPYLLWVSFASILNLSIVILN